MSELYAFFETHVGTKKARLAHTYLTTQRGWCKTIEEFRQIDVTEVGRDMAASIDRPMQMASLVNELLIHANAECANFCADANTQLIQLNQVQDEELRGVIPAELTKLAHASDTPECMQRGLQLLHARVRQLFAAGTIRARTLENWCSVALFWVRKQLNANQGHEDRLTMEFVTDTFRSIECLSRASLQRYVSNTNALIRYAPILFEPNMGALRMRSILPLIDTLKAAETVETARVFMTDSELDRMERFVIAATDVFCTRDVLLFTLMRYTGLRVGGIRNLCVQHCWHRHAARPRQTWMTTEKGGVLRSFIAPIPLQHALGAYMNDPRFPLRRRARFVFASKRNVCRRVCKQSVQQSLTRLAIFAGVDDGKHVTAHSMRRSVITQLMQKNTILQVAEWIGHRCIDVTFQRYWRLSVSEIAARLHMPFLQTHVPTTTTTSTSTAPNFVDRELAHKIIQMKLALAQQIMARRTTQPT